jgi:hypothetical protein
LINGGPAEDIDAYTDGADAVERYLTLMRTHADTFDDYRAVATIRDFVGADERWATDRPGWTVSRREAFHATCREILGQPHWRDRFTATLTPDAGDTDFWKAQAVAHDLGIDTFEATFQRIEQDPLGGYWDDAWKGADVVRARRLAELARTRLPLTEIASGPRDELGMGPTWRPHHALGSSIEALGDHPGIGGDLLVIGLQSPLTRNRYMALQALAHWPVETWPSEARGLIETAVATDPNEKTRDLAGAVLRGEPAD